MPEAPCRDILREMSCRYVSRHDSACRVIDYLLQVISATPPVSAGVTRGAPYALRARYESALLRENGAIERLYVRDERAGRRWQTRGACY